MMSYMLRFLVFYENCFTLSEYFLEIRLFCNQTFRDSNQLISLKSGRFWNWTLCPVQLGMCAVSWFILSVSKHQNIIVTNHHQIRSPSNHRQIIILITHHHIKANHQNDIISLVLSLHALVQPVFERADDKSRVLLCQE